MASVESDTNFVTRLGIAAEPDFYPTSWRSEQRWMFSAASVCLFVNRITLERVTHRMMKLGGMCTVQKSRPSSKLGS